MSTYDVKLLERREIADGTMEFHFTWPDGFASRRARRSKSCCRNRPAARLLARERAFRTRARDSYAHARQRVQARPARDTARVRVKLDGPFGSLTLHKNPARAAVFIAGGIGITPFMSMLRQSARDGMPHRIVLLYSNRRPQDSAFLDELQAIARANANFTLVTTMTEAGGAMVDAPMIEAAVKRPSVAGLLRGRPAGPGRGDARRASKTPAWKTWTCAARSSSATRPRPSASRPRSYIVATSSSSTVASFGSW
jgi:hypothetical protein